MSTTALVLAAHGSRHEPAVNQQIHSWADQIVTRGIFDEVAAAFHQGAPAFSEVVDELAATRITVVPVMTSAGYYCDLVLPRELRRNRRFQSVRLRQTSPLGLHPRMSSLMATRIRSLAALRSGIARDNDYSVAVVGHGTPRLPASRIATQELVEHLRNEHGFEEVIAAFLDDAPSVEQILNLTARSTIIVLPFLIAPGPHALADLPRRLGVASRPRTTEPLFDIVKGRTVMLDQPLGTYPEIVELIVDLATAAVDLKSSRSLPIEVA